MTRNSIGRQRGTLFGIVLLLLPIVGWSRPPEKNLNAASTVKAFYTFHFKNKFDYSAQGLRLRHKWLDEALYRLLLLELKKSEASSRKNEVPELNGDPFTNSQEYPTTFRIGTATETSTSAKVAVFFIWKEQDKVIDEKRIEVELAKSRLSWKISNIIAKVDPYDDLLQFLKRAE